MTAQQLKNSILQMAVQGKLVAQNQNDESAKILLERIQKEKAQLVKDKKIKKDKVESHIFKRDGSYFETVNGVEKCIDEELPFAIPESWAWVRLGSVCNYGECTNIEPNKIDGNLWLLDLEDIEKDTGILLQKKLKKNTKCNSTKHAFNKNQILYSKLRPYLNKVIIASEDGVCTSEILPIKFYGNIIPKYSQLFLMSPKFVEYANQCSYGVKMPRLGTSDGRNAFFSLPPLEEQKRIVAKIEEVLPHIQDYEKAHSKIETLNKDFPEKLKKSVLQWAVQGKLVAQNPNDESAKTLLERIQKEKAQLVKDKKIKKEKVESHIFKIDGSYFEAVNGVEKCIDEELPFDIPESWEIIRLNDIGVYRKGPFGSSLTKSMFVPKGKDSVKVYEQKNAIRKDHTLGDYYITRKYYEEKMKGFRVFPNDIIVSCAGTIGETYVLPNEIEEGIINQALMRMNIFAPINIDYFLIYFDYVLKKSAIESSKGSAIKNIPPFEIFKQLIFPLPPLAEQERIVAKIEEVLEVGKSLSNTL